MRRSGNSRRLNVTSGISDITSHDEVAELISTTRRLGGVVIGGLVGFTEDAAPLVDFPGNPQDGPVLARSLVILRLEDIGREVALLFEGSDSSRPILIGPIVHPRGTTQKFSVERDGERI